ncbi:tyrosine-type recombinase/integrase [Pseudomonadota bacterium]
MQVNSNVISLSQTQFSAKLPRKPKNIDVRPREYLTEKEVEQLIKQAKKGRYGSRDALLILFMYRHGLRVSEVVSLRWSDVDFQSGVIQVKRVKNGVNGIHPLSGRELRVLRALKRLSTTSPFILVSERGSPMTTRNVRHLVANAGRALPFPVHPHMLRHGCGYKLINNGVDVRTVQQYLGHASINSTVHYTKLDSRRFDGLWRD